MDHGEKLQSAESVPLSAPHSLERWVPERDPRAIGNRVITSGETMPPDSSDETLALGKIVATTLPEAPREISLASAAKIYPSGHDVSRETINTLKDYEQELAMDGNVGNFYDRIRSAAQIYQGKIMGESHD